MKPETPELEPVPAAPASTPAATCPMHAGAAAQKRFVDPDDELALPLNKRVITQYAKDAYGATELRLFYDDKEISFDEPELFGFGETLAQQSRFIARSATQWGQGQSWPRVQGLLEQLIEEGILRYADEVMDEKIIRTTQDGVRPSPLPPAECPVARTWDECEAITQELAGRPLELGYLELVVPIFRVAHMAIDADGRQIGEANVFPKPLRIETPTNWRACIYPGTRYLDAKPMNVTALKAMRAHWGQMMAMVLHMREAYLKRFPHARDGWTVGHLERLSTAILALPTYELMRKNGVANGKLHPALSSLFRVTDGVRMTMHQMLFIPIGEPTIMPDAPMNAQGILDYAERNYSFHSEYGVCAGPKAMIEEFLAVLVDGVPARGSESLALDAEVKSALSHAGAALDYGLHGLQAYAAVFSLWPVMTRTYEKLAGIVQAWQAAGAPPKVDAFAAHLRGILESQRNSTYLGSEQWRVDREKVYADMYRQCGRGLPVDASGNLSLTSAQTLTERIAPHRNAALKQVEAQLRGILIRHFSDGTPRADTEHLEAYLQCVVDYFSQEQAILRIACTTQQRINALLGRTPPQRPFSAAEIDIHILLRGNQGRLVPNLGDELEKLLNIDVTIDQDRINIRENAHA